MDDLAKKLYTGTGKPPITKLSSAWHKPEPYIPSPSLVYAVNTALYLRRPLLLEGEPGCGKTRLAYAVAYELGYPLYTCYIRSTTRAQDLLYDYDALGRLYDIQEGKATDNQPKAKSRQEYVTLGELGKAIELSQNDLPSVVLLDEIDKADIDFPNDLLLELDRLQFQVKEVPEMKFDALKGEKLPDRRKFLPLIIITSNREKELPKPFLRRCLFYYIEFPNQEDLKKILNKHFESKLTPLFEAALNKFWQLRQVKGLRKQPATSEFIDWVTMLERDAQAKKVTAAELKKMELGKLPYLETLVKTQSDRDALNKLAKPDG